MQSIDPATGRPLPPDAIQRVLFVASSVHVYNIPPLTSTKGYTAATWTEDPRRHIFTARLRVVETAVPSQTPGGGGAGAGDEDETVKTDVVLEDPSTGQLFAAAPYTDPGAVEPALDSSRFFALRVQDPSGRKAVLGFGFEERSAAFDFGVALQEAGKSLGLGGSASGGGGVAQGQNAAKAAAQAREEEKRDYSLKEGETITVNLGGTRFGRRAGGRPQQEETAGPAADLSSFSLPPPPSAAASRSSGSSFLPAPPSARDVRSQQETEKKTAQELGFDDGQFGEFA
ncbi:Adaptin ear-binding coat-associated protein 2 [Pleurostoma richardsiae]|uniref:Adaptin ear-binding coat-associated protein 2 n=1 Tax=Pleurostoma richardsiae TaxID=41990 RepID=A0AA38VUZ8_9PEZI|nr:Adaptin ear-binding coat-associated protein 2 [Pleurostoma richardsiae]